MDSEINLFDKVYSSLERVVMQPALEEFTVLGLALHLDKCKAMLKTNQELAKLVHATFDMDKIRILTETFYLRVDNELIQGRAYVQPRAASPTRDLFDDESLGGNSPISSGSDCICQ